MSNTEDLFNLAIDLELKVSVLYKLFSELFAEDRDFWLILSEEEENHVFILESAKEAMFSTGFSSKNLLPAKIDDLKVSIDIVSKLISKCRNDRKLSRKMAFEYALGIECSAGEMHYEIAMNTTTYSSALSIFQKLNDEDKNHTKRILDYQTKQLG
ncbi:MAG: rubrerythrin family protein [bacterium]|nr:rubrerythrin family protein [bacterium]